MTILKKSIKGTLLWGLWVCMAACGGGNSAGGTASLTEGATQDNGPITYLEGVYATSTAAGHTVENLFDQNPSSVWRTQNGAGPNEGVMLYFAEPTQVGVVHAVPIEGGAAVDSSVLLSIYVNGMETAIGYLNERIALKGAVAKSLYVRIEATGLEARRTERRNDAMVTFSEFPAGAYVGFQKLQVFDPGGTALHLVPPKRVSGGVEASSTLAPAAAYGPEKLFDARKEFAWVEGNAATAGEGETLTFRFDQPVHVTAIQIWNGYQRSEEHFAANARVKSFAFGLDGGAMAEYALEDGTLPQKITLSAPVEGQVLTWRIADIFPGKKYKDLAISELLFFDGKQPFVLTTQPTGAAQGLAKTQTLPPVLQSLLNRPLVNDIIEGDVATTQSLILREDGTFVLYSTESFSEEVETEMLADGNWEWLGTDADGTARVKIFGKMNNLTQSMAYYQGTGAQRSTRIFSDVLEIDAKFIKGNKNINLFYR